jgi:hypothetical protein
VRKEGSWWSAPGSRAMVDGRLVEHLFVDVRS